MPAGAIEDRPRPDRSPSRASRTGIALRASSRSASDFVKPRGMCCTTRTAAEKPAGSPETTACRAVGPPVEAAITTHSAGGAAPRRARGRHRPRPGPDARPPSARTFATSSSARLSMLMGCTDDLSTKSMAPSSSPRRVTSGPLLGEGGHQQDGHRLLGHEPLEGLEAAQPRHLDVEGDHVGAQLAGPGEALLAVGGEADHLDVVGGARASARWPCARTPSRPPRGRGCGGHGRGPSGFWYTMAPWKRIGTKALATRESDSAWPRKR
jgi:hypothetical protein